MPGFDRLILFDIDGTLLSAGEAPRRAFRRALVEHFGTEGDAARSDFSGKTDPQIVYELMGAAGFDDDEIELRVDRVFEEYLAGLAVELGSETRHHLHPAVPELLDRLNADERVVVGLVTGNVELGARLKLDHFGLWPFFEVGAFGSDDRHRDRLPAIAIDRAEDRTGHRFKGWEVVIVGDTPADIQCARVVGAMAVAVATGLSSRDVLAGAGPDLLLDSLAEWPHQLHAPVAPSTLSGERA